MRRILILASIVAVVLVSTLAWIVYLDNNGLEVTEHTLQLRNLPPEFDGFRIVQVSDLHEKSFGRNQERLIEQLRRSRPDIIVVTGDIVDRRRYNETPGLELIRGAARIAPVYFVSGNHEWRSGRYPDFARRLTRAGAVVLKDEHVALSRGGTTIFLAGIDDPIRERGRLYPADAVRQGLDNALVDIEDSDVTVLLAHRPELFSVYVPYGVDLIFAGHAHGGQIRLPFVGALFAPDQGLFPKYTTGVYSMGSASMVVSRGLGASVIPFRLFNRPEVVAVQLSR